MNSKQVEREVIQGIELVKALSAQAIKANKPASFLVRAVSNLNEYFSKRDFAKCLEVIAEVANA